MFRRIPCASTVRSAVVGAVVQTPPEPRRASKKARPGEPGVAHDNEGSGCGFRTVRHVEPRRTEQPSRCAMQRP